MARLLKPDLLRAVENGFRAGGWTVLYLTRPHDHPARYRISKDNISATVRVYVWNITHGGGQRSASEHRIQITSLNGPRLLPETQGKTLILGYWADQEVFAGFDYAFHSGLLGGSPSLQIGESALLAAHQRRFAMHEKENGELAIAFTPDFVGTYVENLTELHATGHVPAEVGLLIRMANNPDLVPEPEIISTVAAQRQFAVTQTRRALRALDFKKRVLSAYSHACAMCGMQLQLLDGAHILPVSEPGSTDETANGVALCALHHRAYDRGLVTFDQRYRVQVNNQHLEDLRAAGHDAKLGEFRESLRRAICVPADPGDRPNPQYVDQANKLRRWSDG